MQPVVTIGKVRGVPISFHWSMVAIFLLLTWSLGAGYLPDSYPELSSATTWLVATITAALFLSSVLLHELGHVVIAQRNGLTVSGIRLWIFGGVATIDGQPRSAGAEFRIAIAGPFVSAVIAGSCLLLFEIDRSIAWLAAPSEWLFRVNLALLVFNLLPGFPLDGGRVLRAAVWRLTGSLTSATRIAGAIGQAMALGLMGLGLYVAIGGNVTSGLWLGLIGWFLQNAAFGETQAVTIEERLRGIRVDQVMSREFARVPARITVRSLIDDHVLATGRRVFLVADESGPRGIVSLTDVARVAAHRRDWTRVEEAMTPWRNVATVKHDDPLRESLKRLTERDLHQLPVTSADGVVIGILGREDIVRYLETLRELRA